MLLSDNEIESALRGFLADHGHVADPNVLSSRANLFEAGLLDSLMTLELISFCEERFKCVIDVAEVTEEDLGTIAAITALVKTELVD